MIKLDNIKKVDNQLEVSFKKDVDIIYSDLHLDLKTQYTVQNQLYHSLNRKDLVLDYNEEAIKNSLKTLFTTLPGQKILNPEYGLNLEQFLFYPVNEFYARNIGETILVSIRLYEPRINVTNVNVYPNEDEMMYEINIYYEIPKFSEKSFSFMGKLTQNGFVQN
jgi:phage baseplate assembly protein W